jgi:hypothetical protein
MYIWRRIELGCFSRVDVNTADFPGNNTVPGGTVVFSVGNSSPDMSIGTESVLVICT